MKYQTLDEIYAGNQSIRARLKQTLDGLSDEQLTTRPDGEKWSVAEIVEHVAIVDESTMKICYKLLKKAQESGLASDGGINISNNFIEKGKEIAGIKVEAPSFVRPSGERAIADSLAKLGETEARVADMRPLFESACRPDITFPHPFFGDINAHEWLALKGGHEMRHIKQIEKVLAKMK